MVVLRKWVLMAAVTALLCSCIGAIAGVGDAAMDADRNILEDLFLSTFQEQETAQDSFRLVDLSDSKYKKAVEIRNDHRGSPWSVRFEVAAAEKVHKGDVLLIHIVARCPETKNESGECDVPVAFSPQNLWGEDSAFSYEQRDLIKGAGLVDAITLQTDHRWKSFYYSVSVPVDLSGHPVFLMFDVGHVPQTLQIAKAAVYRYPAGYDISKLPKTKATYPGRESDAAWRKAALKRIEKHRMAPVSIQIVDGHRKAVEGAEVEVVLKRHQFEFGTSVNARQLTPWNPDYVNLRERIKHDFNEVSFGNTLKWFAMNGEWGEDYDFEKVAVPVLEWIRGNHLKTRGHVLVWPSAANVPSAVQKLLAEEPLNKKAIRQATYERVRDGVERTKAYFDEWDVVNESIPENEIMEKLDYGIMAEWIKLAQKTNPDGLFAINEYAILTAPSVGSKKQDVHHQRIRMLLEQGAPLGILGLQGHFPGTPVDPETIYKHLESFSEYDLPIQVTELDILSNDPQLISDFFRDFLIICYSHPNVKGVQFWHAYNYFYKNFKEGYSKNPTTFGWEKQPCATMYRKLVHGRWKTREEGFTGKNGTMQFKGHLGEYVVRVKANGQTITVPLTLEAGGAKKLITIN
ncbi:endo-1,4-beta-xylanase [Pontiella sulfatireligans]|uniref:endo-1,4-beta-xylanase n=1 Tax=Pontiella sulfatireligans TaxID=2750658 RepID=A0A6C2UEP5_9BACT|nr:endo-1,4-beta-xylanase [Pontiella sulfatireligans]VGO18650.1 Anti-sigma-I factor RsgI6 [Pontiella sulfatireligans]